MSDDWSQPARIDRELQYQLLKEMAAAHPLPLTQPSAKLNPSSKQTLATLLYLEGHGLCEANVDRFIGYPGLSWGHPKITSEGLDFLEQDGGLKAILSVVTVKFEAQTLRALLTREVEETDLPDEEKSIIKEQLKTLPETALKAGMSDLVTTGMKHLPDAAHWLRTLVGL